MVWMSFDESFISSLEISWCWCSSWKSHSYWCCLEWLASLGCPLSFSNAGPVAHWSSGHCRRLQGRHPVMSYELNRCYQSHLTGYIHHRHSCSGYEAPDFGPSCSWENLKMLSWVGIFADWFWISGSYLGSIDSLRLIAGCLWRIGW